MTKKKRQKKIQHKGCRGRRLEIEVAKSDTLLQDEKNLIQKGEVVDAGPEAFCKVGDIVIFNAWGCDKITVNDKDYFFIIDSDEFICAIL